MLVRVRFAPSPTGNLHLGGFRTALMNYLFAKKHNGRFVLRVEDTDQSRCIPGAAAKLEDDLDWLGIGPHESPRKGGNHGPYTQSERLNFYHAHIKDLIESGNAYECFCSEHRLDLIRKEAVRAKAVPGYDNKCRALTRAQVLQRKSLGEKHVVRLKLSLQPTEFIDLIGGKVVVHDKNDPILIKSDGFPTYHFANVVDDHLMEISHVLRGNEWQVSTGMHMQMYRAFGWLPPTFAHLPVLLNRDGTKLSKRQAHISIDHYKKEGCAPISLANFVTKSGGGFYHGVDKILSIEELVSQFEIQNINTSSCKLDFQLLEELNKVHLRALIEANVEDLLLELKESHPNVNEDYLRRVILWAKPRIRTLTDLDEMSFLWTHPANIKISTSVEMFKLLLEQDLKDFASFISSHNLNKKQFLKDLRLILTGLPEGAPIAELLDLLGDDIARLRIKNAISENDASHRHSSSA